MAPQLQLLPPTPPPVGIFLRPGWTDHIVLQQLLVEGRAPNGYVFDARYGARQRELWEAAVDADLDAVLDPNVQELWTPAGRLLSGLGDIPWSSVADQGEPGLRGAAGQELATKLADHVAKNRFSSLLVPTHYLHGTDDRWFEVDILLARQLRLALDRQGAREVRLYYPLTMPARSLALAADRAKLIRQLRGADIDAIWLRLHPFGTSSSGPLALRRYIEICRDFRGVQVPLVAERTGTVGIALLSYNAVGGIECGVTLGERFDAGRLLRIKPTTGRPFSHPALVYLPAIDTFVSREEARQLLSRRAGKAAVGCPDAGCCRHGPDDMVRDPRRHGVLQRLREVEHVATVPAHRRPEQYLDHLRSAGDIVVRLVPNHPVLESSRRRLDSWRGTLSSLPGEIVGRTAPPPAVGRRMHRDTAVVHLRPVPTATRG